MGSLPNLSILKGDHRTLKPELLHELFQKVAEKHGDKPALIFEESKKKQITNYAELDAKSDRLARGILKVIEDESISPNKDGDYLIAVSMTPSDRLVECLLATWKSGAAYLPLDPEFPETRVQHILNEARPVLMIHNGQETEKDCHGVRNMSYNEVMNVGAQTIKLLPLKSSQNAHQKLAIVLYTSGSTGIPKGVRLPHAVLLNRLQWQWNTFPYSKTESVGVFKTALTFVDSVSEIWGPLLNGLAILIVPKDVTRDPERLVNMLTDYKIERLVLVPSLLRSMMLFLTLKRDSDLLSRLRLWVSSGEPLAVSLATEFFKSVRHPNPVLCNFYGSTEVMGDVTYYTCENIECLKDASKFPIGNPVDNTVVYLLDPKLQPVSKGEVGELYVSGLNLAAGYVNGRDPERFIDNPLSDDPGHSKLYRTGDFARLIKGTLQYEGRTDSQVKIRGHRVDLSEVEKAVLKAPSVTKGVVLCYRPGEMDQALLAFVTCETDKVTGLQIEEKLRGSLAPYMIPQVVVLDNIPLLVNGKIDRQALLKMYENTNNNDDSSIILDIDYSGIPESKMTAAKVLFETVGNVIGRSSRAALSKNSNFYELGGNSLNSIYTVTQLRDSGYFIGITDFITAENLGEVLDRITGSDQGLADTKLTSSFTSAPLAIENKEDVYQMVTSSFYEKADLEQWLMPNIYKSDYAEILDAIWDALIEKGYSFVVKDNTGANVGVALNFDAREEPEVEVTSKLLIVFEFLEHVEGPVRDHRLPEGLNAVFHSFMMATASTLSAQQNISVMQFMEAEVLRIATSKGFKGILTTNTSPLTQQLGTDVYGYTVMTDCQVNQYVASDGTKPFGAAPDSQRACVSWKPI